MKSNLALVSSVLAIVLTIALFNILRTETKRIATIPSQTPIAEASSSAVLGVQLKTSGCQVNGVYPDKECTPGAVFSNVSVAQICTPGYSSSVRNVSLEEKDAVYKEYGIYSHRSGEYEVDHLISLELGGSNDISNLWPEAANPTPGFHQKDETENYLHDQVCSGAISLEKAQEEIANDWLKVYNSISH